MDNLLDKFKKFSLKLSLKEVRMIAIVFAILGMTLLTDGISMSKEEKTITKIKYSLDISTKEMPKVQNKKNDIILKDFQIEQGKPLSTNIKDYIQDTTGLSTSVLNQMSQGLDTSLVNVKEPGTYTYTLTFRKTTYQGKIVVTQKELPNVKIVLKAKKLPTTGTLSRNIKDYVYDDEKLTEEAYKNMILDLEEVAAHLSIPGRYKYKVIYNDTTYFGDFDIVQPVTTGTTTVVCPEGSTKENNTCVCTESNKVFDSKTNSCIDKPKEQS